ncbi:MAG: MOSC domain-containing protein [Rhodobacteraceae bacterium]|nr:MOSC domain-containing protein [Paracoccaceae bacterium]
MGTVAEIWRHPLKAIGREPLRRVILSPGAWLPNDRKWAVAHDRAKLSGGGWAQKMNFLRGVTEPALMAVTSTLDDETGVLTLTHPEIGEVSFDPDDSVQAPPVLAWLRGIWPDDLPEPTGIYQAGVAHLTDVPDPWISINNLSSHRAVEGRVGQDLSIHRWRGNLWLDGLGPWEEFEWIGKRVQIGDTVLEVKERITRCKATMANPETGRRDVDTLAALRTWDHQDFGVYAEVVTGGTIAPGDTVVRL